MRIAAPVRAGGGVKTYREIEKVVNRIFVALGIGIQAFVRRSVQDETVTRALSDYWLGQTTNQL
jgi:hypothetical protein